jgi:hypothetical protein
MFLGSQLAGPASHFWLASLQRITPQLSAIDSRSIPTEMIDTPEHLQPCNHMPHSPIERSLGRPRK